MQQDFIYLTKIILSEKKSETKEHNIYDSIYIKVEKQAKVNCVRCQDNVYS